MSTHFSIDRHFHATEITFVSTNSKSFAGNQKFLRKTSFIKFRSKKSFHDFPKRLFQEPTTKMLEDTLNVFQTIDFRNQTYE